MRDDQAHAAVRRADQLRIEQVGRHRIADVDLTTVGLILMVVFMLVALIILTMVRPRRAGQSGWHGPPQYRPGLGIDRAGIGIQRPTRLPSLRSGPG